MIHRRPPDSRAFDNTTSALLLNALSRVCPDGVELRVYYGHESPLETIQLFSNAIGVVGFHGAGFANAYFAMSRCCVVEITTTAFMPGGASRARRVVVVLLLLMMMVSGRWACGGAIA